MKKELIFIATSVLLTLFVSCSGGKNNPAPTPPPVVVSVESVSLNRSFYDMMREDTLQLTHTVTPTNATNRSVVWHSSDPSVASVSNSGLVTAVNGGTTDIVVTTQDGGFTATCNVIVSSLESPDGFVRRLVVSNRPNTYNLVYLAEGYTVGERVKFDSDIDAIVKFTFDLEPFKTYRDYFRVYSVFAVSENSGTRRGEQGMQIKTAFNSYIHSITNYFLVDIEFRQKGYRYAIKATEPHQIGFLINADGGRANAGGYVFRHPEDPFDEYDALRQNQYPKIFRTGTGSYVAETAAHEFGHGFKLADEYGPYTGWVDITTNNSKESLDAYYNVDYVSEPTRVKWNHFIGRKGYENVGVYEGCSYTLNLYRPTDQSIMNSQFRYQYFNAPSREGIVRELLKVVGEEFTLEKFFEKDVTNGY